MSKLVKLATAEIHKNLQISDVLGDDTTKKHLHNLGLIPGANVVLLKTSGKNGIVLVHQTRLALDQAVLEQIEVEDAKTQKTVLSLDQLQVGETADVVKIFGEGPVRRRLMDMGLTKGVTVKVKKLAPLGDPIDLEIRGYDLSMRKAEAEYILVEKEAE